MAAARPCPAPRSSTARPPAVIGVAGDDGSGVRDSGTPGPRGTCGLRGGHRHAAREGPPGAIATVVLAPAFKADVEVAAERRDARLRDAPVRTEVVSRDFVEQVGARTLADAVEYTTGVRVENNCQNCNFSQVRLLGLEGPYTQILMDGQPTLSSLAQVYGLEQIPARLIDRIEVTKGGGAALLGPGSVGGVINVITREPTTRGAQLDTTLGVTRGEPTVTTAAALDWVSGDRRSLLTAYGQADRVSPVDVTGDGYTEVSRRALEAGGMRAHRVMLDTRARLTVDVSAMREDRRGGNNLDLPPARSRHRRGHRHGAGGRHRDVVPHAERTDRLPPDAFRRRHPARQLLRRRPRSAGLRRHAQPSRRRRPAGESLHQPTRAQRRRADDGGTAGGSPAWLWPRAGPPVRPGRRVRAGRMDDAPGVAVADRACASIDTRR